LRRDLQGQEEKKPRKKMQERVKKKEINTKNKESNIKLSLLNNNTFTE
jgi:hypothetical protein